MSELFSQAENDARLLGTANHYGANTRSYNRSAEKREMDRQRAEITARFEAAPRREVDAPLLCSCPQRDYPHDLEVHAKLRAEWWAYRNAPQWPWSLMLSPREEPSTERKAAA